MPTERGIVTKVAGETAWVKTTRSDACAQCASRGSCYGVGEGEEAEVEVLNPAGAAVGDRVVVSLPTSSFLKANFLLYVFPILALLSGAITGKGISVALGVDEAAPSVGVAFAALIASLLFVRKRANRMALSEDYRPKISRILKS